MTTTIHHRSSMEQGYDLHLVTVTSYDGRRLNGFVFRRSKGCYTDAEETLPWHAPSKRYLSIILKGGFGACCTGD